MIEGKSKIQFPAVPKRNGIRNGEDLNHHRHSSGKEDKRGKIIQGTENFGTTIRSGRENGTELKDIERQSQLSATTQISLPGQYEP